MKKIAFCLQTMVLGGVEKELITVLNKIHCDYDITLILLYSEDIEILKDIPSNVKIKILEIDKGYYCGSSAEIIEQRLKRGKYLEAASIGIKRCLGIGMSHANTDITDVPTLVEKFDTAICYHIHSPLMLKYVSMKIRANKKVAWIHNDFNMSGYRIERLKKYVNAYDKFVAVSHKVETEFREHCPWYAGSISTAHNYLDAEEIRRLAEAPVSESAYLRESALKLLTVGRFSKQKGIDLAIRAASILKKRDIPFHWFLIGHGELEGSLRKMIGDYNLEECFTILGRKANPYPYIKSCDIYIQPSRHEAFGLVILEAKILRKPIVCTDFDGADEQIDNGRNGIIVPVNDLFAMVDAIATLIRSPEKRTKLVAELDSRPPHDALQEIIKHF